MAQAQRYKLTVPQALQAAGQHQAAGALEPARHMYERILTSAPEHAYALTMLASIGYQQGNDIQADAYVDRAIDIYRRELAAQPDELAARAPLVNLLLARGRGEEAEALVGDLKLPINPRRADSDEFERRRRAASERGMPTLLLNTVPKSASESIWNKLAEGLGLGQCGLSIGLFPDCALVPFRVRTAAAGGLIAKEHIPASAYNLRVLQEAGFDRLVLHVRDPRQAALSWAHFVRDDVSMRIMAPLWRRIVPPADVLREDLAAVVDWCLDRYLPLLIDYMRAWTAVHEDPQRPIRVEFLSFELFRRDPDAYVREVLDLYGLDAAGFAAGAEAETVHMRKGMVEEWREVFTPAQQRRAWERIPRELAETFDWRR